MSKYNIEKWEVEDEGFWASTGKKIANRNLWISIPALLLAFAVWIMWGMIIVNMKKVGYTLGMSASSPEDLAEINNMLWTLPAIAGLAGATLRIPNSFLIAIGGGRNVLFLTTALLLIPCVGVGIALQNIEVSYITVAILAALSGFGGGNFASSMSNISYFFPKRVQGTSLGLNAGIGNLGVSTMQFLLPLTMGAAVFGVLSGDPALVGDQTLYVANAGWTWVPLIVITCIAIWFGMNNLKVATPGIGSTLSGLSKTAILIGLGLVGVTVGVVLLVGVPWEKWGLGNAGMWIVLPIVIIVTVMVMKYFSPGEIRQNLNKQFAIFSNKHNWIMTIIYTMTFGSFIGFAAAFPKLIQDVFGYLPNGEVNPEAFDPMKWAFLGPMVGALVRPVGGWLADKVNSGSRVTTISTLFQIVAALGVAWCIIQAKGAESPNGYWWPFFALFMVLFISTGIGNGSTFRSIPYIFNKEQAGPVLGWTSAIAAYGAFVIPSVFGQQILAGTVEYALYGFTAYYVICLGLNWYYYDRPNSGIKC